MAEPALDEANRGAAEVFDGIVAGLSRLLLRQPPADLRHDLVTEAQKIIVRNRR